MCRIVQTERWLGEGTHTNVFLAEGEYASERVVVPVLRPDAGRLACQAASQLHLYRETRNMARLLRNRMKSLLGAVDREFIHLIEMMRR